MKNDDDLCNQRIFEKVLMDFMIDSMNELCPSQAKKIILEEARTYISKWMERKGLHDEK